MPLPGSRCIALPHLSRVKESLPVRHQLSSLQELASSKASIYLKLGHPTMQVVHQKALEAVAERLRDTKRSVRRDAATHLMAVFRYAQALIT